MSAGAGGKQVRRFRLPRTFLILERKEAPPVKDRRKLERKRKAERARRLARKPVSLAYHGNKYKRREFVMPLFRAEVGIHESSVVTGRRLTDRHVRSALETLILQMRGGSVPESLERTVSPSTGEDETGLIIWSIRRNWADLFATEPPPPRDDLIGVLRTILGSVELRSSVDPTSRRYLDFLEGFLARAGVSVRTLPVERIA